MKKLSLILMAFLISLPLLAQNQIIKTVSTGGSGWKRVAYSTNSAGRGNFDVTLITKGGSSTPYAAKIAWFKGWSDYGGLNLSTNTSGGYWSDARITSDGTKAYLEVNFTKDIAVMTVLLDQTTWTGCGVYDGPLPNGGGTIVLSAKFGRLNLGEDDLYLSYSGKVGIGTTETGSHKLAVEGTIGAREVKVESGAWSDFVFKDGYQLKDLKEVEIYIQHNQHLPDIPSEKEVLENGIELGKMDAKLLQKIEEFILYIIEMNKKLENQQQIIDSLLQEKQKTH